MATTMRAIGSTILQDPESPELDIVFVHGLDGHPRNSWTYFATNDQPSTYTTRATKYAIVLANLVLLSTGLLFMRWSLLIGSWFSMNMFFNMGLLLWMASAKTPPKKESVSSVADHTPSEVFWPRDLLPANQYGQHARILTYGYDSSYFNLIDKVNFSDITSHGENLLNELARIRADCHRRPLMFIAHSLGGLVVKAALNDSLMKSAVGNEKDLHAVVNSTFAAIFFGTPHRGTGMADFGLRFARIATAMTLGIFNPNILRTLAKDNEVLKGLRKRFNATLEHMISRNQFESSTFQEDKGFSKITWFTGKVVNDDSSELVRCDRNFHINADHVAMCKFSELEDPAYKWVEGEIGRHILRQQNLTGAERNGVVSSLEELGQSANLHMKTIVERTENTLRWLFTSGATFDPRLSPGPITDNAPITLESWLSRGCGIFWITGLPGSGKSTTMRHVYESPKTFSLLEAQSTLQSEPHQAPKKHNISSTPDIYAKSTWTRIGLFITNFEGHSKQGRWQTMLHGLLLQLFRSRQDLLHPMKQFAEGVEREQRHLGKNIGKTHCVVDWSDLEWSNDLVQRAMEYCVKTARRALKVLVIVDGLDELENDKVSRDAARFLKNLAEHDETRDAFRICVASRSEQHLLDVFRKTPRIEIHRHTRKGIRRHAWSVLRRNDQFNDMQDEDIRASLEPLLGYIVENAAGVFLWAHSMAQLADKELNNRSPIEDIQHEMEELPTTMSGLYQGLLGRVEFGLRLEAYIALEVVLRLGNPSLETVFCAVQAAEPWLKERARSQRVANRQNFRKVVHPKDLQQFRDRLVVSCRCMLRFHESAPNKNGRVHQLVSLVHASAREYLLRLDFQDVLFPQDDAMKLIGNGHGYCLLHARSWLDSLARPEDDWDMDCMNIVLRQAPMLESTMKTEDIKIFFKILDDMDRTASELYGEEWLSRRSSSYSNVETRLPSFLAWAITAGMHKYVVHRVSQQHNPKEFINSRPNGQKTCPLLHFCSDTAIGNLSTGFRISFLRSFKRPLPLIVPSRQAPKSLSVRTFKYLIKQGADINTIFRGRTVLRYIGPRSEWQPDLGMVQFLLNHGVDPSISVTSMLYSDNTIWILEMPLLHTAVYWEAARFGSNLDAAAALYQRGAKLDTADESGVFLAEALYHVPFYLPSSRWKWVLERGARITKFMVTKTDGTRWYVSSTKELFFPPELALRHQRSEDLEHAGICDDLGPEKRRHDSWDILRQPNFRRREWYTEEAAELAEEMKPSWFAAGEAYQASRPRVLPGEDVED